MSKAALTMLSTALEMEEKGKKFYQQAIAKCQDRLGQEIFTMLRDDEGVHLERIRKIYQSLSDNQGWTTQWENYQIQHEDPGVVFTKLAKQHGEKMQGQTTTVEALDVGLDLELQSVTFYQEHLAKATDAIERKFLDRMVYEERGHHALFADLKLYYADPASWFRERERHGFDGA